VVKNGVAAWRHHPLIDGFPLRIRDQARLCNSEILVKLGSSPESAYATINSSSMVAATQWTSWFSQAVDGQRPVFWIGSLWRIRPRARDRATSSSSTLIHMTPTRGETIPGENAQTSHVPLRSGRRGTCGQQSATRDLYVHASRGETVVDSRNLRILITGVSPPAGRTAARSNHSMPLCTTSETAVCKSTICPPRPVYRLPKLSFGNQMYIYLASAEATIEIADRSFLKAMWPD
jgi:hypothetical protein